MIEAELLEVNKTLTSLAARIRLLQFIVIGGMALDFIVNNSKAVAALVGR